MKSQSQSPLRSRLREFAKSFRDKSSRARLKAGKQEPTLNPAPMNAAPMMRIKGWLNAHDLLGPKGRR